MKIIFDTCVILDYLLDREEYSSNAEKNQRRHNNG